MNRMLTISGVILIVIGLVSSGWLSVLQPKLDCNLKSCPTDFFAITVVSFATLFAGVVVLMLGMFSDTGFVTKSKENRQ